MLAVLNKRWLSQGWRVMDTKDSEPMAIIWIETLDRSLIPHDQYYELYQRSIGLRARRMAQGLKCEDFSVDMMVACWSALREELKQKEIERGRTLQANAESQCQDCFGSGYKTVMDGNYATSQKCDHGNS